MRIANEDTAANTTKPADQSTIDVEPEMLSASITNKPFVAPQLQRPAERLRRRS